MAAARPLSSMDTAFIRRIRNDSFGVSLTMVVICSREGRGRVVAGAAVADFGCAWGGLEGIDELAVVAWFAGATGGTTVAAASLSRRGRLALGRDMAKADEGSVLLLVIRSRQC